MVIICEEYHSFKASGHTNFQIQCQLARQNRLEKFGKKNPKKISNCLLDIFFTIVKMAPVVWNQHWFFAKLIPNFAFWQPSQLILITLKPTKLLNIFLWKRDIHFCATGTRQWLSVSKAKYERDNRALVEELWSEQRSIQWKIVHTCTRKPWGATTDRSDSRRLTPWLGGPP